MRKYLFVLSGILLILFACKRFDSNAYNVDRIQGRWVLSSVWDNQNQKQLKLDFSSILIFDDKICTEENELEKKTDYFFTINDYKLYLSDSIGNTKNVFLIHKLEGDSLILESDIYLFNYISSTQ